MSSPKKERVRHKLVVVLPDPELCLKSGGVVNNPISVGEDIAEIVEDTLNGIMPVISDGDHLTSEFGPVVIDGDHISESVRDTVNGIMPVISDDDR